MFSLTLSPGFMCTDRAKSFELAATEPSQENCKGEKIPWGKNAKIS